MIKFKSKTLMDIYGDHYQQYDLSFMHFAIAVTNKEKSEYKLLEQDYDNLYNNIPENQFRIYFYNIQSFIDVKNNTDLFEKYAKYMYVRANDKKDLDKLSKLLGDSKINVIMDYYKFKDFNYDNINLVLQVDKISELPSSKLLELNKKYNINQICLGQIVCFNENVFDYYITLYKNTLNFHKFDNSKHNHNLALHMFISNDFYDVKTYLKIEKELYKLISNISEVDSEYTKIYKIFNNIVHQVDYNYKGLETEENDNQNLSGILFKHLAVCEGFAKAFYQLCSLINNNCIVVCGGSSKVQGGHIWNQVYIDEKWYNVDAAVGSNLYKEKGKIYMCLIDDSRKIFDTTSILRYKCEYYYDFDNQKICYYSDINRKFILFMFYFM